jgi:hypothetical protein
MAIDLAELPAAVKTYMDSKVTVGISSFQPRAGEEINPKEEFTFFLVAVNARAGGGVPLSNVRYELAVADRDVATIRVPSSGSAVDTQGEPLEPGTAVAYMLFSPSGDDSRLEAGEVDVIPLSGVATEDDRGGSTEIKVKIIADVDLPALFPRDEDSRQTVRAISVEG